MIKCPEIQELFSSVGLKTKCIKRACTKCGRQFFIYLQDVSAENKINVKLEKNGNILVREIKYKGKVLAKKLVLTSIKELEDILKEINSII